MFHGEGLQQFSGSLEARSWTNTGMTQFANNMFHREGPQQFTGSFEETTRFGTVAIPQFTTNTFHGDSSTSFGPFIQGGFTDLLLQNDQASELLHTSRRLDFDVNSGGWK